LSPDQIHPATNQRVLEQAYNDPAFTLPNAIYIDAVDVEGGIRTGTEQIHPLTKVKEDDSTTGGHGAARYAYVATFASANIKRLCASQPDKATVCKELLAQVEQERKKQPLTLWSDAAHGRSTQAP